MFADALREHLTRVPAWHFDSTGRSMHPAIPGGSRLAVEPLPPVLALGDLLAFVQSSRAVVCCHRVIALRADGAALTQGDNNRATDGWIEPARHVGVVRRFRTGGRWYHACEGERPTGYRRLRQRADRAARRLLGRALRDRVARLGVGWLAGLGGRAVGERS
jgi:hypothetical protein